MIISSNAKNDGYKLMSEYDLRSTLILWPFRKDVWRNPELVQKNHLSFIEKISKYNHVYLGVPKIELEKFKNYSNSNVTVIELPQNDAWMRDSGPLFVKNSEGNVRIVNSKFNAWGGLYDDFSDDVKIVPMLAEKFNYDRYLNDLTMEGGNIITDGNGMAILVEDCIVNKNRNNLSKEEIAEKLKYAFGLDKIIWIKSGFVDDETGGHVDNVVQFLPNGELIINWTDDINHPMYKRCREIYDQLTSQVELKVHKIITPSATYRQQDEAIIPSNGSKNRLYGDLLTASYINFYIAQGALFIPKFNVNEDEEAFTTFKMLCPNYDIVQIESREYILGGGCLHCLTIGADFK